MLDHVFGELADLGYNMVCQLNLLTLEIIFLQGSGDLLTLDAISLLRGVFRLWMHCHLVGGAADFGYNMIFPGTLLIFEAILFVGKAHRFQMQYCLFGEPSGFGYDIICLGSPPTSDTM